MNNQMNISEVEKNIRKIRMYRNDMSIKATDIMYELRNINMQYKCDGSNRLNELSDDFYKMLKRFDREYNNKEVELNSIIRQYEESIIDAKTSFNNIESNIR